MLIMRRQQWENELREIENAISELERVSENTPVYKVAGPILIASTRDKALQDLKERREIVVGDVIEHFVYLPLVLK